MEPLNAHSDIHEWRVKRWEPVNWRRHDVLDAFVNPQDSKQIMIRGTVDYGNKDGTNPASRFGAWLRFVEEGGQLRLQHYEVWSVSASSVRATRSSAAHNDDLPILSASPDSRPEERVVCDPL